MKHVSTLCGQDEKLVNIELGGTHSDHYVLKSK
jgi:hypothetical protein